MCSLYRQLYNHSQIYYLLIDILRNTNQDGLENFFGGIKINCQVSKTPIAIHFRSAYVTSILNSLTCNNSMKSNCEKDTSTALLNNFHKYVLKDKELFNCDDPAEENPDCFEENDFFDTIIFDPQISQKNLICVEKEEAAYISSLICNKLLQEVTCKDCMNDLETFSKTSIAVSSNNLKYPSETFIKNLITLLRCIDDLLPNICTKKQLKKTVVSDVINIKLDKMGCKRHKKSIKNKFTNHTVNYAITTFCNNINDLLSGKNKILASNFKGVQIYEVALSNGKRKKMIGKFTDIFEDI